MLIASMPATNSHDNIPYSTDAANLSETLFELPFEPMNTKNAVTANPVK